MAVTGVHAPPRPQPLVSRDLISADLNLAIVVDVDPIASVLPQVRHAHRLSCPHRYEEQTCITENTYTSPMSTALAMMSHIHSSFWYSFGDLMYSTSR